MVAQEDLKYCWQVTPDSHLIRWYKFIYQPEEPLKLTFCRLFWGTLLSPFVFIVALLAWPIAAYAKHTEEKRRVRKERRRTQALEDMKEVLERKAAAPPKTRRKVSIYGELAAERIAAFVDTCIAGCQVISVHVTHPVRMRVRGFADEHHKGLTWIWRTLLVTLATAFLGGLAYGFYSWAHLETQSLYYFLVGVGFVVFCVFLFRGIYALANRIPEGPADRSVDLVFDFFGIVFWPIIHGAKLIGRTFSSIGAFFGMGYYTIKTRTCPRVEIVDELDKVA